MVRVDSKIDEAKCKAILVEDLSKAGKDSDRDSEFSRTMTLQPGL